MTLYLDYMSQPSRACAILIKLYALPIQLEQVLIHKGETKGEAFRLRNPLGKVPFLQDGALGLPESAAILTFLATKYKVPDHWYPASPPERAAVDAALHWYHSTIRAGCARLVFHTVLAPKLGIVPNPAYAAEGRDILTLALGQLEGYWLQGGARPFMSGEVSLADLLCCCEMEQLSMMQKELHGTDLEECLQSRPLVRRWMSELAASCGPTYEEVHAVLRQAAAAGRRGSGGRSRGVAKL